MPGSLELIDPLVSTPGKGSTGIYIEREMYMLNILYSMYVCIWICTYIYRALARYEPKRVFSLAALLYISSMSFQMHWHTSSVTSGWRYISFVVVNVSKCITEL